MGLFSVLVAAALVNIVAGHVAGGRDADVPSKLSWSDQYHVKGEQTYVSASIVEPFELWHDETRNVSRKDVYNGTVRYFLDLNFNASSVKKYYVHPETDSDLDVTTKCSSEVVEKKEFDTPGGFLPKTDKFVFKGKGTYDSKSINVWEWIKYDEKLDATENHEIYVARVDAHDVPVRYTVKSFIKSKNGLLSYSIVNYYDFEPKVNSGDLSLKSIVFSECSNKTENNQEFGDDQLEFDLNTTFHGYIKKHGKIYKNGEHQVRKDIFQKNIKYIMEHNQQENSYKLGVNQFTDRGDEEMAAMSCLLPMRDHQLSRPSMKNLEKLKDSELPKELDLRAHGLVTSVKNQLSCGSCWAFTTAATVEVALAVSNGGSPIELSEQSLIDCSWSNGNSGCDGGLSHNAMQFVLERGLPSDQDYGLYKMEDGICHLNSVPESKRHKIKDWEILEPDGDITLYQTALVKFGALAANIYASKNLLLYNGGLFYDSECAPGKEYQLNHAVTIVGYGVENGTTYWLVKNSWGAEWGEAGYVRFPATDYSCGLILFGVYAVA